MRALVPDFHKRLQIGGDVGGFPLVAAIELTSLP